MLAISENGARLPVLQQKTAMVCRSTESQRRTDAANGVFLCVRPSVMVAGSGESSDSPGFLCDRASTPIRCTAKLVEGFGDADMHNTKGSAMAEIIPFPGNRQAIKQHNVLLTPKQNYKFSILTQLGNDISCLPECRLKKRLMDIYTDELEPGWDEIPPEAD